MSQALSVAIVGATGAVGTEMLSILERRPSFKIRELRLFASARSKGRKIRFRGRTYAVGVLAPGCFRGCDVALFDASTSVSKEYAKRAAAEGAFVVDNSSAFRLDPRTPLVVPEVNGDLVRRARLVAGPNCTTIPLVMALSPIARAAGLRRVIVSTYQAISGAGAKAEAALRAETSSSLAGRRIRPFFKHPAAFNCVFHETIEAEGYTDEDWKIIKETRRILGLLRLPVAVTAVRVPVFRGHSEAVFIETKRPLSPESARRILRASSGVEVVDEPSRGRYPTPLQASGRDAVYVGRIRRDLSVENGLILWLSCDNLRKGAALNAVQIAELAFASAAPRRSSAVSDPRTRR